MGTILGVTFTNLVGTTFRQFSHACVLHVCVSVEVKCRGRCVVLCCVCGALCGVRGMCGCVMVVFEVCFD